MMMLDLKLGVAMKSCLILGFALPALAAASIAHAANRQTCNVHVDITDTDPKGTNVRAAPGGAVVAQLRNPGDGWIGVHVIAQSGDWYAIDRATRVGSDLPPAGKTVFRGMGYLHKSMIGVSGIQNGGAIYADHDVRSRAIDPHAAGDQPVDLLGCWGDFLKVHVRNGIGWTKEACTNMNTTCA